MTVHVDELTSDVAVDPESTDATAGGSAGAADDPWGEDEQFRELRRRLAVDRLRTAAEGFDD
jgi:hypothetical protein